LQRFCQAIAPHEPRKWLRHAANSAAALRLPATRLDLARVGMSIYGGRLGVDVLPAAAARVAPRRISAEPAYARHPDEAGPAPAEEALEPVLTLKAKVVHLKSVPAARFISYGCTYRTRRPSRVATLPIGYADGFGRGQSNRGSVLLRGQRAPVIGRVCMDQVCVDVTGIPGVEPGDEAVIVGRQASAAISLEDVAALEGTVNYELLCGISPRVTRVYAG
jgi:alanine racemase